MPVGMKARLMDARRLGIESDSNFDIKSIPTDLLPVEYGSKTLTDTESWYANTERELLAVVASVEKFHTFCYGRSTIVLSDYKPLASIVKKDLVNAPPRLQRLLLRLQKYDMTILYKPGKNI